MTLNRSTQAIFRVGINEKALRTVENLRLVIEFSIVGDDRIHTFEHPGRAYKGGRVVED
jgi:hypothetical protein